jgi:hypothetical protein
MPTALLALVLLAATIDPRLDEPLRLLAEVGARDTAAAAPGPLFAELPALLGLTLVVVDLPHGAVGWYDPGFGRLMVDEDLVREDPRVVAATLAHELQHALDTQRLADRLLAPDCLAIEVRGYVAQAIVARQLWPDELPNGTPLERRVAAIVRDYEANGAAGISARLHADVRYREQCAQWPA